MEWVLAFNICLILFSERIWAGEGSGSKLYFAAWAGNAKNGSVDGLWINGENFAAMKEKGLLFGPIVPLIDNYKNINAKDSFYLTDFNVPVDGSAMGKSAIRIYLGSKKLQSRRSLLMNFWILLS